MTFEPVIALADGRKIRCAECRQDLRAIWDTPRQGTGHVSVRYNDNALGGWRCTLNGQDVTNRCREALAGPQGWAILYIEHDGRKRMVCSHGQDHALVELVHGDVVIERRNAA